MGVIELKLHTSSFIETDSRIQHLKMAANIFGISSPFFIQKL